MTKSQSLTRVPAIYMDAICDGLYHGAEMAIFATLDIPQRLEYAKLQKAFRMVARTEPLFAGRYYPGVFRGYWEIDPEPEWDLEEHEVTSEEEAQKWEEEMIAKDYTARGVLPADFVLLHMDGFDRLLCRVSHIFVDAGGTKTLMYLIAEAYRKLEENPSWKPEKKPVNRKGLSQLLGALRLSNFFRIFWGWLTAFYSLMPRRYIRIQHKNFDTNSAVCKNREIRLSKERVIRLKERWKPEGITLNDIAVATMTRATYKTFHSHYKKNEYGGLVITSDMRKYLPEKDRVCNLSALAPLIISKPPFLPPEEHLRQVAKRTGKWKKNYAGLGVNMSMWPIRFLPHFILRKIMYLLFSHSLKHGVTGLTNLGPIDDTRLNFGKGACLDAKLIPPVGVVPLSIGGATGYRDTFSINMSYRVPCVSEEAMTALFDQLEREIQALE